MTTLTWLLMVLSSLAYPVITTTILALAVAWLARRRALILILALVVLTPALTIIIFSLLGQLVPTTSPARSPATALRVAHLNSLIYETNIAPKLAFATSSNADIISMVEVRPALITSLTTGPINATYPFAARSTLGNPSFPFPMMLLSRWPIELVHSWSPRQRLYKIEHPTNPFYVLQMHPNSPHSFQQMTERNTALAALNPATLPQPLLLVGDFNTAPWDAHLRPLLQHFKRNTTLAPTFPAVMPLTPIDLLLTSPQFSTPTVSRVHVEATDHLGLIADFPTLPTPVTITP